MTPHLASPLLVIGFGNMGESIVRGAVRAGLLSSGDVIVAEPEASRREAAARLGIVSVHAAAGEALNALEAREAAGGAGRVLLAVKPQMLAGLAAEVGARLGERAVISVLAGMRVEKLRSMCGGRVRVVRVMPNLPASIGEGVTAIATGAEPSEAAFARRLFEGVGPRVMEIEEGLMDAFTALAGSGPAYLFYLAEAMIKAGVSMGFTPEQASLATRQTLVGAAKMLAGDAREPAALRAAVTSRGGTTAAAIERLDARGAMDAIEEAVKAACARGAELGR